jgi:hypothetical protein
MQQAAANPRSGSSSLQIKNLQKMSNMTRAAVIIRARMTVRVRRIALLVLACSLVYTLAAGVASAAPAQASRVPGNSKGTLPAPSASVIAHDYSRSWTFKSGLIDACVTIVASGNISYTFSVTSIKFLTLYHWDNQQLNVPKLTATVHSYHDGSCTKAAKKTTKMEMGQSWSGYACSFNPSLSVGIPWALGIGFWPSCGSRDQGHFHTIYPVTSSSYTQGNTGNKASFGDYSSQAPTGPCYGVYVWGSAFEGATSDSFTSGALSVCLPT